ncbi:Conjugative transposon protein TraM [Arcticibacter svalbardensis MN12-7]|uniref:Conjugative transposon protein TraM n=1 Tax=Arcticibacter svalbardensis MN12-7 TaxID=1150600 RepID=R9H515_9SPHI|nr:conjugative transposon protein TraM [Arcticibacter svalbardensis]EOR96259.1 Conjugative transposon protein TraM [Arcticibacter svalbardensis MN12-7]
METTHSEQFLRQRKFYLMLPLLILPFLTLAFWALGGGKNPEIMGSQQSVSGFNHELPPAQLGDKQLDKMSLYEQAKKDSMKSKVSGGGVLGQLSAFSETNDALDSEMPREKASPALATQPDAQESRIRLKLQQINQEISKSPETVSSDQGVKKVAAADPDFTRNVDRLESLMQNMGKEDGQDPEMKQINDVMEKILDIQHPERVQQRIRDKSVKNGTQAFPVQAFSEQPEITLLEAKEVQPDSAGIYSASSLGVYSGFYGLEDVASAGVGAGLAVEAMIAEDQKLTTGASVKIQLLTDMYVKGIQVPSGGFLYGICSLTGDRLMISISSLLTGTTILPVSLSVYDLDGLPGIGVPGVMGMDAAKQGTEQAMQGLELSALDPSLTAQVANAGIQTAKGLFRKKMKQVKVDIRAGYHVLLVNNNQQR